jgi:hypothetical protein
MYNAEKLTSIDLGRQGENLARTVEIDVSSMLAQWPDAVITLLVKRKHDAEPYIADTTVKDGVLFWPITTVETADAGDGKLEIRATCGEVIAKSATGTFRVTASLTGSGTEPPASEQGWVDKVIAAGAGVEQSASQASKAADRAELAAETAENSIAQIQSAAQTVTEKAKEAQSSAEAASAASIDAVGSAQAAREAQAGAEEAQTSAAGSASLAEQAKAAAEAAQKAAAEQAASAEESAQAAGTSAQAAQTSADAAAASEQAAQTAATQATQEAQAASTAQSGAEKASDNAKASEEAASGSAAAARASADAATESRQAASDASTEALERLNGAEAARDAAEAAQEAAEVSAAQAAQSAVEAGEAAQAALGILDDAVTATDSTWSSQRIMDVLCAPFEVSGNPITCHPVEGSPLGVTASWEPKQHFDWVRREAESTQITTTGAQMLQPTSTLGGAADLVITANDDGGYTYVSTDAVYQSARFYNIVPITLKVGVSYTLSIDKELDVDIRVAGGGRIVAGETSVTFTPSADTLVDHVAIDRPTGHSGTNTVKVMLCEGTTAKPWEPYTGGQAVPCPVYPQEIADSLPAGDYYVPCSMGGYWKVPLDAAMGGVPGYADAVEIDAYTGRYRLVRRTAVTVLDGSESWSIGGKYLEDGSDWYYNNAAKLPDAQDSAGTPLICDHYPMGNISNNTTGNGIAIVWRNVRVRWGEEGTVEDWKARLAASPVTVRYALAAPVVVTGQAEKVTDTSGLAELGAKSMGLSVPDPDHPCMITGMEAVELRRIGKNFMPYSPIHNMTKNGITFTEKADGIIHISGTASANTDGPLLSMAGQSLPSGAYRGIDAPGASAHLVVWKKATGENFWYAVSQIQIDEGDVPQYWYITVQRGVTTDTDVYVYLQYGKDSPSAGDWEPYRGNTYLLRLPQLIYGGEMDAATGNGSATVYGLMLDGSEGWSELTIEDRVYFQCALSSDSNRQPSTTSSVDAAKRVQRSSHFTVGNPWAQDIDDCFWVFSTPTLQYPSLRMRSTSNFSSVEELQSYLAAEKAAGTPVTIVYETIAREAFSAEGASPIPALIGINTLYTDADRLTVSGRADLIHTLSTITDRLAALETVAAEGGLP